MFDLAGDTLGFSVMVMDTGLQKVPRMVCLPGVNTVGAWLEHRLAIGFGATLHADGIWDFGLSVFASF